MRKGITKKEWEQTYNELDKYSNILNEIVNKRNAFIIKSIFSVLPDDLPVRFSFNSDHVYITISNFQTIETLIINNTNHLLLTYSNNPYEISNILDFKSENYNKVLYKVLSDNMGVNHINSDNELIKIKELVESGDLLLADILYKTYIDNLKIEYDNEYGCKQAQPESYYSKHTKY